MTTVNPDDPAVCGVDQDHVHDHELHRNGNPPKVRAQKRAGARLGLVPTAVPGISLTNYSLSAQGKGWGAPCTQARTTITLSNGVRLTVATRIARLSTLVLNECIRRGYAIRQADTGAYNCRYISGTTVWSNHAWAIAIDVNWQTNPYTTSRITDKPQWLFDLFNRYGFANGADYSGKRDWMHHEFMGTPAQADVATALAEKELGSGVAAPAADPNDEILTEGDSGEAVRVLQVTLNRWYPKLTPLVEDGDFGPATTARVKYFQGLANLTVDGEVGPASRIILGLEVPSFYDKPAPPPAPPAPPPPPYMNPDGAIAQMVNRLPQELKDRLGPLTGSEGQRRDGGWVAFFQNGLVYYVPNAGTFFVWGAILTHYALSGYENGPLGYPVSHEFSYTTPDQVTSEPHLFAQSNFEHGFITWDSVTQEVKVFT